MRKEGVENTGVKDSSTWLKVVNRKTRKMDAQKMPTFSYKDYLSHEPEDRNGCSQETKKGAKIDSKANEIRRGHHES